MKLIPSGEKTLVLAEREVDLEDGRDTAALTAAAMVVMLNENKEK